MSLSRLYARVADLEGRHTCIASLSTLVIVWLADGNTRATALQKAALTPAEMARRVVLVVQYAETRSDAPSSHNAAAMSGSAVPSCG